MHICPRIKDSHLFLLLVASILLLFYNLWVPSIWNPNEAFYAEAAREMLETGDFITPHFNYEPRFQKPILLYWLVSVSYLLLGISEFATRLVSVLLASGTIFITFLTGKFVCDSKRAGLLAAVVLATSFEFNQAARYTSPEIALLFFITLSLYAFLKGITESKNYWLYISYISMAFATLTKGPVGVVLPGMIIVVFIFLTGKWNILSKIKLHYGIILIGLIAAPWFLYMIYTYGEQYTSVVWGENVKRFLGSYGKSSNIFYYFSVLPWNFLPWFPFLIIAFIRSVRDFIGKKLNSETIFIGVWFLVVFCFFSFSKGKLPPYMLPLFPAASILIGKYFHERIEKESNANISFLLLSLFIATLIITAIFYLSSILGLKSSSLVTVLILLLLPALVILRNRKPSGIFVSISSAMLVFLFFFLSCVLPHVEMKRPYRLISEKVSNYDPQKSAKFISFGYFPYNLPYYAKCRIYNFKDLNTEEIRRTNTPKILMLDESDYAKLDDNTKNSCKILSRFQLYTGSESRFLRFIKSFKNGKDFNTFLLLSCDSE